MTDPKSLQKTSQLQKYSPCSKKNKLKAQYQQMPLHLLKSSPNIAEDEIRATSLFWVSILHPRSSRHWWPEEGKNNKNQKPLLAERFDSTAFWLLINFS